MLVTDADSSTGLTRRLAVPLAYAGWWATGLVFWLLERRDPKVRFHAAQSLITFGAISCVVGALGFLTVASLSFVPASFNVMLMLTVGVAVLGVLLWAVLLWRVAGGGDWRLPLVAGWADRLSRL